MSSLPRDAKELSYLEVEDEDCSGRDYSSSAIDGCSFRSIVFRDSSFKGATLDGVTFQDCDLSNCDFSEASFLNCSFLGGKLTGASFLKGRMKNCTFSGVSAQYLSMDEMTLNGVTIEDSRILQGSLSEIKHKGFSLLHDDLSGTSLKGTSLKGISLKGTDLSGIYLSDDCRELKGARLDVGQALDAARLFGVDIIS